MSGGTPTAGAVSEPLRTLLRLEGAAVAVVATFAYFQFGGSWLTFAVAFMLPDVAAAGYLWNGRVGALCYNLTHWYVLPLVALVVWIVGDHPDARNAALIWMAHIGADRAFGFGLKYALAFQATHLGWMRNGGTRAGGSTTRGEAGGDRA